MNAFPVAIKVFLFCDHPDDGANNFLKGNPSVLESVLVIIMIMVIIIGIEEKIILFGKNESGTDVGTRESCFLRIRNFQHILFIVIQIPPHFIPEVGGGLAIPNHLGSIVHPDRSVIGGDNKTNPALSGFLKGGPQG